MRTIVAVLVLAALFVPEVSLACPVCYGAPGSPLVKGANNGVWFLLGIVGLVQIGFAALFISFWRRAKAMRRLREQFHIVENP
ncbi:MAG TPA: hypothetical protein VMU84_09840 [Thermoanaerobaculia bacterium]|nr:hypothetical protein [Thermoanaerobaculia bacterium]